jgi:hypothetical protein
MVGRLYRCERCALPKNLNLACTWQPITVQNGNRAASHTMERRASRPSTRVPAAGNVAGRGRPVLRKQLISVSAPDSAERPAARKAW